MSTQCISGLAQQFHDDCSTTWLAVENQKTNRVKKGGH